MALRQQEFPLFGGVSMQRRPFPENRKVTYASNRARKLATNARAYLKDHINSEQRKSFLDIFQGPAESRLKTGLHHKFPQPQPTPAITASRIATVSRATTRNVAAPIMAQKAYKGYQQLYERGFWKFVSPQGFFGKHMKGMGKTAMLIGAVVGGISVMKSMGRAVSWTGQNKYKQVGVSTGPGYISWSKKKGMPANHLSTDNLSNSLHRMRHTSII